MVEQEQTRMAVNRMVGPTGPPGPRIMATAAKLTPKEVSGILRRHILLMVSLIILGLIIGGTSWYLLWKYIPKYTAETYLKVLPPTERDPMVIGGTLANKDIQYGHRLSMASLITTQSSLLRLIERNKVQETEWFEQFGKIEDVRIRKAFKNLRKRFRAYAQRDGAYVVVSMTCGDKAEAALIVNEMVDLFLASQGSAKRAEVAEKLARFNDQRDNVQRDLDAAERALSEVRAASRLTDLGEHRFRTTIQLKLDSLELEQSNLVLGIKQVQANIENLKELAVGPIAEQVKHEIETDPVMVLLAQQIALQESRLAGRLTKFGENHRVVRETRELINEISEKRELRKAEIAEQTRQSNLKNAQDTLIVLQERLVELERMREEAAAKKRDLDLARVQYERRASIRDERKKTLDSIKEQIEKLRIVREDPETPKVRFAGYAPEPLEVSAPRWEFYFPGGTILGLLFGIGLAFLIELLNDLVRTPRDVSRYLHIPLLGVIPDAAEDEQLRKIDLYHVVRQAPYSIISESYRRLRTNLKLSSSAEASKALLVSSGMAGDGKTSVAVNLATTFVAENKRVLLIDANFCRPNLHTVFPKAAVEVEAIERPDLGLSNLLMAQCGFQEVIRPTGIGGFDVIDTGPLPPNPAELLGGAQMEQLVKQQRENYDYVIVDGPPVLLISDAKMLTRFVDATILVFNAVTTRRGAALRTIRELKEVNATIVGCVLFAVKAMKGGYFHEQFKSYREYQKLQLARPI